MSDCCRFLVPPTIQDDEVIPIAGEIEAVARAPVDAVFPEPAANPIDVRQIAKLQPDDGGSHLGRSLKIEIIEP